MRYNRPRRGIGMRDWSALARRRVSRLGGMSTVSRWTTLARRVRPPTLRVFGAGRRPGAATAIALPRQQPLVLRLRPPRRPVGSMLTAQNVPPQVDEPEEAAAVAAPQQQAAATTGQTAADARGPEAAAPGALRQPQAAPDTSATSERRRPEPARPAARPASLVSRVLRVFRKPAPPDAPPAPAQVPLVEQTPVAEAPEPPVQDEVTPASVNEATEEPAPEPQRVETQRHEAEIPSTARQVEVAAPRAEVSKPRPLQRLMLSLRRAVLPGVSREEAEPTEPASLERSVAPSEPAATPLTRSAEPVAQPAPVDAAPEPAPQTEGEPPVAAEPPVVFTAVDHAGEPEPTPEAPSAATSERQGGPLMILRRLFRRETPPEEAPAAATEQTPASPTVQDVPEPREPRAAEAARSVQRQPEVTSISREPTRSWRPRLPLVTRRARTEQPAPETAEPRTFAEAQPAAPGPTAEPRPEVEPAPMYESAMERGDAELTEASSPGANPPVLRRQQRSRLDDLGLRGNVPLPATPVARTPAPPLVYRARQPAYAGSVAEPAMPPPPSVAATGSSRPQLQTLVAPGYQASRAAGQPTSISRAAQPAGGGSTTPAPAGGDTGATAAAETPAEAPEQQNQVDLESLARKVYLELKQRLRLERERAGMDGGAVGR